MTPAARQAAEQAFLTVMRARRPDLIWRLATGSSNTTPIKRKPKPKAAP